MQDGQGRGADQRWAPWAAVLMIALFLLACLPFAIWQVLTVNVDEARYTVAAALMMATGDYIVPTNPWGGVRLLKPPLAYYYVVAGFSIFGQSLIGAKLFWLLSAAGIIGLTWALARRIGASAAGAAVAVAALVANPHIFRAALTHIPDIPMMLGLTMALVGFARIIATPRDEAAPVWAFYLAWIGIAWAFFAKGLLALVLVALSLAFRAAGRGLRRPSRHEVAAIVLAVVIGGWWYAVVAIREPALFVEQFLGDQVTQKTSTDLARIADTLVKNVVDLVQGFFPIFLAAIPFTLGALRRRPRREVLYLVAWCVTVVVLFSFGAHRTERYMLPAMPAFAALLGLGFSHLAGEDIARRAGRAVRILLPVTGAVGLLTAGVVFAGGTVLGAAAVLLGIGLAIWALWRAAGTRRPAVALTLLAILPLGTILSIAPAFTYLGIPSITDISVAAIRESGVPPEEIVVVQRWQLVERIGLRLPPIEGYRFVRGPDAAALEGARLVVTTDPAAVPALEALGFAMTQERAAPGEYPFADFLRAIRTRDLDTLRERWGEQVWIGRRA